MSAPTKEQHLDKFIADLVHPITDIDEEIHMRKIAEKISAFVKDEEGLTMVEYAIAGSLVAGGAVVAFTALGTQIAASINWLKDQMTTGPAGGA